MSQRTIVLSPDQKFLLVTSEYNDEIRLILKSYPGSVWNSQRRVWSVPSKHTRELIESLAPYRFLIPDDLDADLGTPGTTAIPIETEQPRTALSVSEVTARVSRAVSDHFPEPVWVKGELTSYDKGSTRRHLYFELVEKMSGQDEIAARLAAVIFQQQRRHIEQRLAQAPESIQLRDGLGVLVHGRLDFYPRSGRLQLIIDDVDPAFTLGELAMRRQEILQKLRNEGLLDRNLTLPWPALPLRIGLATAAESDALHDFLQTLRQSAYGFEVWHYPAAMQGPRLEREMIRALDYFEAHRDHLDLVVIIRGGGSRSDLAWFDNLRVARKVALHPLKIAVGIGHERDRSVLDEIAASEKTPTALAEFLVSRLAEAEAMQNNLAQRLAQRTRQVLTFEGQRQHLQGNRLASATRQVLTFESQRQRHQGNRLASTTRQAVSQARYRIERQFAGSMRQQSIAHLSVQGARIRHLAFRLRPTRLSGILTRWAVRIGEQHERLSRRLPGLLGIRRQTLELLEARLSAVDPRTMLARGYAIVRDSGGQLIHRLQDAPPATRLVVQIQDGQLLARVESHLSRSPFNPPPSTTGEEPDRGEKDPT